MWFIAARWIQHIALALALSLLVSSQVSQAYHTLALSGSERTSKNIDSLLYECTLRKRCRLVKGGLPVGGLPALVIGNGSV